MKPANRNTLAVLFAIALLSGCASSPSSQSYVGGAWCPPPPEHPLGERAMLRYHACLASMSAQKQGAQKLVAEYASVAAHFVRSGDGADRVKLAMLLSLPGTTFYSPAAALKQLGTPPGNNRRIPSELRDLAQFVAAEAMQQQALDDKARNLEKDLAAEKQRSEALRAKIDSVKDLERAMTQRESE